ncbi:Ubiquitin carboxyl-terminal hydrolase 24 [Branchiostoma belcheri]|nr:Ubiquitin carboxyl-terminal hydrolase 24 [Branchiostoma belcheri]
MERRSGKGLSKCPRKDCDQFREYVGVNSADSTSCSILLDASSLLALRVRRWDPSQHGTTGLKYSRIVRFTIGETVTVEKQPGEQLKYKVKAAVIHHGASALSGHYTAVVGVNNRTYLADDDYTNTITLSGEDLEDVYPGKIV